MTRTKIALAAVLLIGTGSAALAENGSYSNPAKRHATQQASKRVDQNMSKPATDNLMMNVMDRASSPFACGG
jgi:hypothetical protein